MILALSLSLLLVLGDFHPELVATRAIKYGEHEQLRIMKWTNEQIDELENIRKTKISIEFSKKDKAEKEGKKIQEILKLKHVVLEKSSDFVDLGAYVGGVNKGEPLSLPRPEIGEVYMAKYIFVRQISEKNSFLGEIAPVNFLPHQFYFSGFDTTKLVDNAAFDFKGLLYVEGTHSYASVLGAKLTVLELRRLTEKEIQSVTDAIAAQLPPKPPREWTDVTGKHKTDALLTEFDQKNVTVTKTDGKTVVIPILKMSKKDQKIVRIELGLDKYPIK